MATVVKVFEQLKKGSRESDLNIEVQYDPKENVVTEIIRVWSYNYRLRAITDMTEIFSERLSASTELILQSVDWYEEYRMQRASKVEMIG